MSVQYYALKTSGALVFSCECRDVTEFRERVEHVYQHWVCLQRPGANTSMEEFFRKTGLSAVHITSEEVDYGTL